MPFWVRLIVLYLVLGAGLAGLAGVDWRLALDLLILAAGFVPLIVKNSPKIWLFSKRLHYWVANTSMSWNVSFSFSGAFRSAQLESFSRGLVSENPADTRILELGGARALVHYHRTFVIELAIYEQVRVPGSEVTPGARYDALSLTILDQHVSYRRSKAILENELVPLVEKLKEQLALVEGNYSLRVAFNGANPFLAMYLQQLRGVCVRELELEVAAVNSRQDDYFRVTLNNLIVNARSLEGFRRSALRGLTFGAMGA